MGTQSQPKRFLIVWFIAGVIVLPVALALSLTVIVSFQTAMSELADTSAWDYWEDYVFLFFGSALLITGFCIGTLQKAILRRHLRLEIRRLTLFTALGAALAGIIASHLQDIMYHIEPYSCCYEYDLRYTLDFTLPLFAFLGIMSSVQALTFRRYFSTVWPWVAAHLGGVACACLIVIGGRIAFPTPYDSGLIQLVFAVLIISLGTGLLMLWLVRESRHLRKAKLVTPAHDVLASPSVLG